MNRIAITYLITTAILLSLVGCTKPPRVADEFSWPPYPAKPQIEYERSISGSLDLKRNLWGKVKDFFLGKSSDIGIEKPYGVSVINKSKLLIVDTAKKGILLFDTQAGTVEFHNSLGRFGYLQEPVYVLLDSKGFIYVSDSKIGKIAVFDPEFKFQRFIGNDSDFVAPVGMAFSDDESKLYVVDTRDHKVKIFSNDGGFISSFGRRGDEKGEFHYPLTIKISKDTIYIVDSFHFAVQAFDLEGNFLFSFGPKAVGMGQMARPRDIAVDTNGNLYITDAVRNNVQVYTPQGELLIKFGDVGISAGQFQLPAGIFIDNNNKIYIADSMNKRVQIFNSLISNMNKEEL